MWLDRYGPIIASAANAVQIQIMNVIYRGVADWLTERENYRTGGRVDE